MSRSLTCSLTVGLLLGLPAAAAPDGHGDRVLVILSAKTERGHVPAGLDRAAALPGVDIERLDSSQYRNLMPCYELVVAGSRATVAEARSLAATLRDAGIDHTIKPAGRFVGPRPELDSACKAMGTPTESGDQHVVFGQLLGIPVAVPDLVADRATQDAPPLVARSEEAWSAPLPAQTVGAWSVGEPVSGWSYARGPLECTIDHFALGVEGTAHFGWREAGLSAPPPCGPEQLVADLSCSPDIVAVPGKAPPTVGRWTGDWTPLTQAPPFAEVPALMQHLDEVSSASKRPSHDWRSRPLQMGPHDWHLVTLEMRTGDGEWVCGGGDYHALHVGVLGPDGRPIGGMVDVSGHEVVGLYVPAESGGVWRVHVRDIITGSQSALGPGLPEIRQERGYCDCPC